MLKYKDKGQRIVFDDDGNARPVYEMEGDDKFRERGLPEEQRQQFIEQEKSKVSQQDLDDKLALKARRKEKRDRRKQFERDHAVGNAVSNEDDSEDGVEGPNAGGRDLLQDFLDDTRMSDSDVEEPDPKREKKWFEKEGKAAKHRKRDAEEVDAFEDLENLAANLIDK